MEIEKLKIEVATKAIRQAAISRQLTRQITRLLITSGEFLSEGRGIPVERCKQAQRVLARADRAMQRAMLEVNVESRKRGVGVRQDDLPEGAECAGAIDRCGLFELLRQ